MPSAPITTHQQLTAGDDCMAVDGRALVWTSATWPPDLPGATFSMVVGHDQYNLYGNLPVTWTLSNASVSASGAPVTGGNIPAGTPVTISGDLTATQTSQLGAGAYDYVLEAKLVDGHLVTLAAGTLTVLAAPSNLPLYPPAV